MTRRRIDLVLGVAIGVAGLAYDPSAKAAAPKRVLVVAIGLALAAFAASSSLVAGERARFVPSRAAIVFAAFASWSAISLFWGSTAGAPDVATFAGAATIALAAGALPRSLVRRALEIAAATASAGASLAAIIEHVRGARGVFLHGGQGNANWLGLLVAFALPLVATGLARAARSRRPERVFAFGVALAVDLVGLALSHSRVAWVASALTLVPLFVVLVRAPRVARALRAVTIGAVAAVTIASFVSPMTHPPSTGEVEAGVALRGRAHIWRASLDGAIAELPLGGGRGSFSRVFLDAQGERLAELSPRAAARTFVNATTAHDDWLEALVAGGPIALVLFAGALVLALRSAWRARDLGLLAAIVAFAIDATGDSPIEQPAIAALLALALASPRDRRARARVAPTVWIVPAIAGALALLVATRAWLVDRALSEARASSPAARGEALARAAAIDPESAETSLERGLSALADDRPRVATDLLEASLREAPDVGALVALAEAERAIGRVDRALADAELALCWSPGSIRAHVSAARAALELGDLERAANHAAIARSIAPSHPGVLALDDALVHRRLDADAPQRM